MSVSPNLKLLQDVFLRCPVTGERQKIQQVRSADDGIVGLEITTRGKSTAWVHRITTEETRVI